MGGPSVYGVGSDLVEIGRFRRALDRHPTLAARLFSDAELAYAAEYRVPAPHLAARFAAKEAAMKALGVGLGTFALRDVEVARAAGGRPEMVLHGGAQRIATTLGVTDWRLSLSHTGATAIATAVALA
jgi:holo-[acyl-carrier protein] synthase